jgi:hypothetical protein
MHQIADLLHFIFNFLPYILIFVPTNILKKYKKILHYLLLLYISVPLHWYFFNNKCVVSEFSQYMGGLKNTQTGSPFSEIWLRWLYEPLLNLSGRKWNEDNISLMVNINARLNILVMWIIILRIL